MKTSALYQNIHLAIACPMANEREAATRFIREVLEICRTYPFKSLSFHVVLDRSSRDGTIDILKALQKEVPELEVIFAPENRNVVDAYKRGYRAALENGADWILEIDAGYSHSPSEIPRFLETMAEGGLDCVFGSRFCQGGKMMNLSLNRYLLSFGGTWLTNILLGTRFKDMTSGFELFTRNALNAILAADAIHSQGPFFQTEIRAFAHRFRTREVPITYTSTPSHRHEKAVADSFENLWRLFCKRIQGDLPKSPISSAGVR